MADATSGVAETRDRILDVAIEVLARNPDAGMGEIASAAGVVRRTVYGYFPSRSDLVLALTNRAVSEIASAIDETASVDTAADAAWAEFITRLWPLVHRYRILVVLRRSAFGDDIHALLTPVDAALAELVGRGQREGTFGRHLPDHVLSHVAWSAVFSIADSELARGTLSASAATMTSLLVLGVAEERARALVNQPS